jgi:hypothetical protein
MRLELERLLAACPETDYCAVCLSKAAGFTSPADWDIAAALLCTVYREMADRRVSTDDCSVCRRTLPVVRRHVNGYLS